MYRIMSCLAIDEYRRIMSVWRSQREADFFERLEPPDFWEEEYEASCAYLASVNDDDTFRVYSAVTDEDMKNVKRQYLPTSLRHLSEKELQKRLSEIDRQIIDRLAEGGSINDVRKEFEKLQENGGGMVSHRQFFESRRAVIIQRANLKEPKSWSRGNRPRIIGDIPDGFDWDDPDSWRNIKGTVIWPAEERERRERRREKRRESQRARRLLPKQSVASNR